MNPDLQADNLQSDPNDDQSSSSDNTTGASTAYDRSSEMLEGLFALLKEDRPPLAPATRISSAEQRLLKAQGITDSNLGDHVALTERRQYGQIEHYVEWLAECMGIPCRFMFHKPRYLDDDVLGFRGFTAIDAVGLLIAMEEIGIRVSPVRLVEALLPEVQAKLLLTDSDHKILTYKVSVGKRKTVLRSSIQRDSSLNSVEEYRDAAGYRYTMTRQNGQALSLEVRGPKYRELKKEFVTCDYCGAEYETNNPSETRRHREMHREAQHLLDPKPSARLVTRLALGNGSDIVDSDSPIWMQEEVRKRARKFRREFRYDFTQWPDTGRKPITAGWHGYLLTAGNDGTIAGACAFHDVKGQDAEFDWSLQWVWIAPKYRRQGILLDHWPVFLERYGSFFIEPPLSDAMQGFIAAHGTDRQKEWLAIHTR